MINLREVSMCIILNFWLVGCTNNASISAPINIVIEDGGRVISDNINICKSSTSNHSVTYGRNYQYIPKSSRVGHRYIVNPGDTPFYIVRITRSNFRNLENLNNISELDILNVSQGIQTDSYFSNHYPNIFLTTYSATSKRVAALLCRIQGKPCMADPDSISAFSKNFDKKSVLASSTSSFMELISPTVVQVNAFPIVDTKMLIKNWKWPASGKIINNFSLSEGGNKGLDIAGCTGQPIFAAADGHVVYAGNTLRGYGNLIIIKHNNDYLSAYAHNDTVLVREQQAVKAGQKVATMGNTGTSLVRLHFEIRYKGKSVNPLLYLPRR